ncbi:BglG family transcription antiterminator [Lachnospiraceae bacterium 42-17]|nr:BglG family transcription antiterminator [Dorea sp.]
MSILKQFSHGGYMTAENMAAALNISVKTVRLRIKEISLDAQANGFSIVSKPRLGYILQITDEEKWNQYFSRETGTKYSLPDSIEERIDFLLIYLLFRRDYIKIDELCDFLFVSRTTLTQSLKQVEQIVARYNISIDRRSNYGLKMTGEEYDFRRCIGDYFARRNSFGILDERKSRQLKSLEDTVLSILKDTGIHMTETSVETFIHHVYVSIKRIKSGFPISSDKFELVRKAWEKSFCFTEKEAEFIDWLLDILSQRWQIEFDEAEKSYISLHLACKRIIETEQLKDENFIISEDIEETGEKILDILLDEFNVNLKGNFHIRMMLNSHLVPFEVRILNEISNTNELLPEIRKNFAFPYTMAARIGEFLEEKYEKPVSEDEIGYFAMIFALALEEMREIETKKSDILIVCNSGKGSSRLLKYRYEKEFGDYLNHIYICDRVGLSRFDFSRIEYVFTTIPLTVKIPVPVIEIGTFLESSDIVKVKSLLKNGKRSYLSEIYTPERFFIGIKGDDKKKVLENFCTAIARREKLPENFLEAVMKREELGQTDFGNLAAMPHPYKLLEEETKVFVGVLEKPVQWTKNIVQVLFLTSIGKSDDNLPVFYEVTAKVMGDKEGIERLIKEKQYHTLMDIIENTE